MGVTAFVLKYRLGPAIAIPIELGDAQRAIRMVRARAQEFGVLPDRIGMMGFSAGGHLASTAGTHFDAGKPRRRRPDRAGERRPDFLILGYPVISFDPASPTSGRGGTCWARPRSEAGRSPSTTARDPADAADVPVPHQRHRRCRRRTACGSTWRCGRPRCRPRCTSSRTARTASAWRSAIRR